MNDSSQNSSHRLPRYLSPRERSFLMAVRRRRQTSLRLKRWKETARRARGVVLALAFVILSGHALAEPAPVAATAGQIGPAILHYERAQWLAPRDAEVARKLAATREQAGIMVPAPNAVARAVHVLNFDALTALASVSLILFCFLVLGTRLIPVTRRTIARRIAGAAAAVAILAASTVAVRWPELQRSVVMGPDSTARIAPAESAAAAFAVKQGEIVRVRRAYGAFLQVQVSDGRTGWLPRSSVEKILPSVALESAQRS